MRPIFELSLWTSIPILLMLVLRKTLGRQLPRVWILRAWLMIAIRLMIPFPILPHHLSLPAVNLMIPKDGVLSTVFFMLGSLKTQERPFEAWLLSFK